MPARVLRGLAPVLLLILCLGILAACGNSDDDSDLPGGSRDEDEEATAAEEEEETEAEEPTDAGDEDEPTPADNGGEDDPPINDECQVRVTGDVETSWESSRDAGYFYVGTDHWLSEDEKRQYLSELGRSEAEIEEALAGGGEPIIAVLTVDCLGEDAGSFVSLTASSDSTLNDFPFGPGTYPIVPLTPDDGPEAGEIEVIAFGFDEESSFTVGDGGGEMVIGRWDTERIEGTFRFAYRELFAQDGGRTGEVHGTFSFGCAGSAVCE